MHGSRTNFSFGWDQHKWDLNCMQEHEAHTSRWLNGQSRDASDKFALSFPIATWQIGQNCRTRIYC